MAQGSAESAKSPRWKAKAVVLSLLLGVLLGLSAFTFSYAEGLSYFSPDPKACVNCHIMTPQYDSWQKSSHHAAASCVDCHLPHSFGEKYIAKAENGWHHSRAFTMQDFHEPIYIKGKNADILQENCIGCHSDMVHEMVTGGYSGGEPMRCVHCHATAGHGTLPTSIGGRGAEVFLKEATP